MINEKGFSLAELLVTLAVLGLILAGVFGLQQQGTSAYLFAAGRTDAQDNARVAVARMVREFLTASSVGASPNCATGTNDITFTFVDDSATSVTVRYFVSGSSLLRNQSAPAVANQPGTLITGVQSLTIVCYDAASPAPAATSVPANVRSLDITLTTIYDDGSSGQSLASRGSGAVFAARVRGRNL